MANNYPSLNAISNWIDQSKKDMEAGALIFPQSVNTPKGQYEINLQNIDYRRYIDSADYHYFVSRVLMYRFVALYSFFSGYQCIENYFKGYLKSKNQTPPNTHNLAELLKLCRDFAPPEDTFLHHNHSEIIVLKYSIYYELPRYPVYRRGPEGGAFGFIIPDDIFLLDYFVYQMRALFPDLELSWDILGGGHMELQLCQENCPEFYKLFFKDNINFMKNREKAISEF